MITPTSKSTAGAPLLGSRPILILLFLCALGSGDASAEVSQTGEQNEEKILPLPRWNEQDLRKFRSNLPSVGSPGAPPQNGEAVSDINDLINTPLASGPRLDHFFSKKESGISPRLQVEDMRLFLPEAILSQQRQSQPSRGQLPTPLASLKDVTPEFLSACEKSLPKEYLIDPDQLIPEIQNHDMMRLLGFHAQDARIKLHVVITGRDQKLPEGAEVDKFASGSLLNSDACLVIYPLGEPWRTRLFVSRSIHNQISSEFLTETIQACLQEALQTSDEHDQLRRYTIHLSTRLFWLQKALGTEAADKPGTRPALAEFSPQSKEPAAPAPISIATVTLWLSAGLLLLGLGIFTKRQILHRLHLKRQRRVWMLAEPETVPRLGGAFTGGGGGMIRYS